MSCHLVATPRAESVRVEKKTRPVSLGRQPDPDPPMLFPTQIPWISWFLSRQG